MNLNLISVSDIFFDNLIFVFIRSDKSKEDNVFRRDALMSLTPHF